MAFDIQLGNYKLGLVDKVVVRKSVETLADTAEIVLPAAVLNKALEVESKIKRGDAVLIKLGYDLPTTEFTGYIQNISTNGGSITIECEDELFNLRKPLKNKEYKDITLKTFVETLLLQVDASFSLECSYVFKYGKFVVNNATLYDILRKVQDETKANIYLDGKTLHIHPAESRVGPVEYYDFTVNIENDNLKYMSADQRRYEVQVEGIMSNGKRKIVTVGTTGGDKRSVKIYGVTDEVTLKNRGLEELKRLTYDGYEGSITGWLEPYCAPTWAVVLIDSDYPDREGKYFVKAVTTTFSSAGGVREIELGVKLSGKQQ